MVVRKDKLYTIPQVSKILKVSRMTLNRWNNNGKLVVVKKGHKVRYTGAAIQQYLKNNFI